MGPAASAGRLVRGNPLKRVAAPRLHLPGCDGLLLRLDRLSGQEDEAVVTGGLLLLDRIFEYTIKIVWGNRLTPEAIRWPTLFLAPQGLPRLAVGKGRCCSCSAGGGWRACHDPGEKELCCSQVFRTSQAVGIALGPVQRCQPGRRQPVGPASPARPWSRPRQEQGSGSLY
jgi:hypothetical protein